MGDLGVLRIAAVLLDAHGNDRIGEPVELDPPLFALASCQAELGVGGVIVLGSIRGLSRELQVIVAQRVDKRPRGAIALRKVGGGGVCDCSLDNAGKFSEAHDYKHVAVVESRQCGV